MSDVLVEFMASDAQKRISHELEQCVFQSACAKYLPHNLTRVRTSAQYLA
jgi:hypothetical protein